VSYVVIVSFGLAKDYEILLHDDDLERMDQDQARAWLLEEFQALECIPTNPTGKILVLDMILQVAQYSGRDRFDDNAEWSKTYAVAVAVALGRPAIRVDVPNFVVG
jgi:hypothetical protein